MSWGAARGQFHIECGDSCTSRSHLLIERDYEDVPFGLQVIYFTNHEAVVEKLTPVIAEYFKSCDDESTFFLQPIKPGTLSEIVERMKKEVEEVNRQMAEEAVETPMT